jgi:flagellar basal-body rod protein FlgF
VLGRGGRTVRVGDDGRVDPRSLDVVRLENPRKEGDNLVTGTPAGGGATGQVRAGALEASGADAARSMVDMIASLRAFEAGQRVTHTIDETLAKSASQVGGSTPRSAASARPRSRRSSSSPRPRTPTSPRR